MKLSKIYGCLGRKVFEPIGLEMNRTAVLFENTVVPKYLLLRYNFVQIWYRGMRG